MSLGEESQFNRQPPPGKTPRETVTTHGGQWLAQAVDAAIYLLLVLVLLMAACLFCAAFGQHREAVCESERLLGKLVVEVESKTCSLRPSVESCIDKLRVVEEELFDANTVSFLFQFMTLVLVTVGAAILKRMLDAQKCLDEAAQAWQRDAIEQRNRVNRTAQEWREQFGKVAPFFSGVGGTLYLASKSVLLHALASSLAATRKAHRSDLIRSIHYCLSDVMHEFESAEESGYGFEPKTLLKIVKDHLRFTSEIIEDLRDSAKLEREKAPYEDLLRACGECERFLDEHLKGFLRAFDDQMKATKLGEPDS